MRDLDLFILNPSSISDHFEPVTPRETNGVSSGYSNFRVYGQKPRRGDSAYERGGDARRLA